MNEKDRQTLAFFGREVIRYNTAAYLVSKNPFFAWQVYLGCRDAESPLPEWLLKYLDSVAYKLAGGEDGRSALGIRRSGGGKQPAAMMAKDRDRLDTYQRYLTEEKTGKSLNAIIDDLAHAKDVDQKTIRNHLDHVSAILESNSAS